MGKVKKEGYLLNFKEALAGFSELKADLGLFRTALSQ